MNQQDKDNQREAVDAQIELPPMPSVWPAPDTNLWSLVLKMSKAAYGFDSDLAASELRTELQRVTQNYASQAIAHDRQQRGDPWRPHEYSDTEIETLVEGFGLKWNGDYWICEDADLHPMVRSLLYRFTEAPQPVEPVSEHDLNTSKGGRAYLAEFFAKKMRRHDFQQYITNMLAADFACVLAKWLRDQAPQPAEQRMEPVADLPAGAIENGRAFADRLETDYSFECQGGPLRNCSDWQEFRRCFEYLAEWAAGRAPQPAEPIAWPEMPPSKGQSQVLFEDGYAEGWAKCIDMCKAAVKAYREYEPVSPSATRADFELWAKSHGCLPLDEWDSNANHSLAPATYRNNLTEIAWRAWANKPRHDKPVSNTPRRQLR
ncbi:hypothetical protein [Pusillimonas sp. NJUB218]|uniref:hypothetical protein n=1 Tax=Pusillimonas sp. NJUB218 TaxID=2023230 RepID=UPI000F4CAE32|nr:hypothetical protein [Pusillimonas sp. NJUB218]ROT45054.1 hypothetical protein CHR62_09390 [Pusillimonas sp. NJUB218]